MLVMEFVTLAGLAVLSAVGLLAASALSWMAWLTVLALLFIQGSDTFLALSDLGLVSCCCCWGFRVSKIVCSGFCEFMRLLGL